MLEFDAEASELQSGLRISNDWSTIDSDHDRTEDKDDTITNVPTREKSIPIPRSISKGKPVKFFASPAGKIKSCNVKVKRRPVSNYGSKRRKPVRTLRIDIQI